MKFFLDTEFIERGPRFPIQLISLGMVSEDGRELYLVSSEFDPETANDWVKANVLAKLDDEPRYPLASIAEQVTAFVGYAGSDKPEFWGYYADYDWVVFCQIFGTMMDLPAGWPMYCNDLKQLLMSIGNPRLPPCDVHRAIDDARWLQSQYEYVVGMPRV